MPLSRSISLTHGAFNTRRVQKELKDIDRDKTSGVSVQVRDNNLQVGEAQ